MLINTNCKKEDDTIHMFTHLHLDLPVHLTTAERVSRSQFAT